MHDYRFDFRPPTRPGRTVFVADNLGRQRHELFLIRLPDDLPPLAEQLRGTNRRIITPLAAVRTQDPGGTGTFAVDLDAGRYGLTCFIKDTESDQPHALKGMVSEFRIVATAPLEPQAR